MKHFSVALGLLVASTALVSAQVTVEVSFPQEQFLAGEALPTTVKIKNLSGQTLHLGNQPDWLTFSVESAEGFIVIKTGEVPVLGEFDLESSEVATKRVDLAPYFVISKQGRYSVTATVRIRDWRQEIESKPKKFEVIEGAKLWTQDFGLPIPPGATNAVPEVRTYTLEQANYLRSELRLYLRLTNPARDRIYKVVAIGPMVSFGQPEAQIDKLSKLHLLYQNGARSFEYSVFNTDGEWVLRQTYYYSGSRPRLKADDDGGISVQGGQRRPSSTDIPPQSLTNDRREAKP
jgi:hypothetical protein